MSSISQAIYGLLAPLGPAGLLLCVFALFYLDAIIFPTLPELFTVIIFLVGRLVMNELLLAALMLLTILIAEVAGLTTLYLIAKRVRVPKLICKAVMKYRDFLLVRDERMILVNRVAPVLPFIGAFVAILNWSFRKALVYTMIGGMLKYGIILALSGYFLSVFQEGTAETLTLILVFAVIGTGFALSIYRRAKMRAKNADRAS